MIQYLFYGMAFIKDTLIDLMILAIAIEKVAIYIGRLRISGLRHYDYYYSKHSRISREVLSPISGLVKSLLLILHT